jgi:hypothetical protein
MFMLLGKIRIHSGHALTASATPVKPFFVG